MLKPSQGFSMRLAFLSSWISVRICSNKLRSLSERSSAGLRPHQPLTMGVHAAWHPKRLKILHSSPRNNSRPI